MVGVCRHKGPWAGAKGAGGPRQSTPKQPIVTTTTEDSMDKHVKTVATLLVPYSVDSRLMVRMQEAEDKLAGVLGGGRVRIVEKGGDVLAHLLTRNDPWASKRTCTDPVCVTCLSRTWIKEQKKVAKENGQELPKCLIQKTSHQCRREGVNYSLQCLHCALEGVRSIYWGESGLSSRQRHSNHHQDVERGLASNPMVQHSVEVHGGKKPHYLSLINTIEKRPLYRAVRESVQIGQMERGPGNINRCNEWGTPRVPMLSVVGGDAAAQANVGVSNPRPDWTKETMLGIKEGRVKRIRYWVEEEMEDKSGHDLECDTAASNIQPARAKRLRTGPSPLEDLEEEVVARHCDSRRR